MKKFIILIIGTFLAVGFSLYIYMYPQANKCTLQNEFEANISADNNLFTVSLKRKDGQNFVYYPIKGMQTSIFVGFKFADNRKLNTGDLNVSFTLMRKADDSFRVVSIFQNFATENNRLMSTFLSSGITSQRYQLPLETGIIQLVKEFKSEENLDTFMQYFKGIMDINKIKGKEKIKFYVKFPLNKELQCVYFESPEVTYDFDKYEVVSAIK